jgi:hypothetical protein
LRIAKLRLLAEPFEGGPEQRGEETGRAFEGELGCVGHLGAAVDAAEGHGVDGDDRLVFSAEPDALTGDELAHDVGQLGLPAEEGGGVEIAGVPPSPWWFTVTTVPGSHSVVVVKSAR